MTLTIHRRASAGSAGGGGVQTLLKDTFTDTTGVLLINHAMDVGPGWSVYNTSLGGSASINADSAQLGDVSAGEVGAFSDAGQSNVTLTVTMAQKTALMDSGVILRGSDSANFLLVEIDLRCSALELFKKVAAPIRKWTRWPLVVH